MYFFHLELNLLLSTSSYPTSLQRQYHPSPLILEVDFFQKQKTKMHENLLPLLCCGLPQKSWRVTFFDYFLLRSTFVYVPHLQKTEATSRRTEYLFRQQQLFCSHKGSQSLCSHDVQLWYVVWCCYYSSLLNTHTYYDGTLYTQTTQCHQLVF